MNTSARNLSIVIVSLLSAGSVAGQQFQATAGITPVAEPVVEMLPGVVKPAERVILSAPFDGVLMNVGVAEGDVVRSGQPIATMDDRVAQASVRVAKETAGSDVEIRLADSQLQSAIKFADRVAKAHRQSAASDLELDRAQAAVVRAKRMLEGANEQKRSSLARLDLEETRLAEHTVTAPFDGRVIHITAREGESMNRAQKIAALANVRKLEVEMQVPLSLFRQLHPEQEVRLQASSPVDAVVLAKIKTIDPNINAATQTFRCRLQIDNQNETLPAGFTVRMISPTANTANVLGRAKSWNARSMAHPSSRVVRN